MFNMVRSQRGGNGLILRPINYGVEMAKLREREGGIHITPNQIWAALVGSSQSDRAESPTVSVDLLGGIGFLETHRMLPEEYTTGKGDIANHHRRVPRMVGVSRGPNDDWPVVGYDYDSDICQFGRAHPPRRNNSRAPPAI